MDWHANCNKQLFPVLMHGEWQSEELLKISAWLSAFFVSLKSFIPIGNEYRSIVIEDGDLSISAYFQHFGFGSHSANFTHKIALKTQRPVNNRCSLTFLCVWSHLYPLKMNRDQLSDTGRDFVDFGQFSSILGQISPISLIELLLKTPIPAKNHGPCCFVYLESFIPIRNE